MANSLTDVANLQALMALENAAVKASTALGHSFLYAEALDDRSVTFECSCGAPAFVRLGQPNRGRALRQECPNR